MRIPIREQLGLLVLLCSLLALMVLAVATWTQNRTFVIDIRLSALSLTASLKSSQVSAGLLLFQTSVRAIATRLMIQSALQRYNDGNTTESNWVRTGLDLQGTMSGMNAILLQAIIFPKNDTGAGNVHGLVNITGNGPGGPLKLPLAHPNGSAVYLGDSGLGYPPQLYPNLTYTSSAVNETFNQSRAYLNGNELHPDGTLVLGPYAVNESFFLISMTVSINNNTSKSDVLGWLTIVLNPSLIYDVVVSPEGMQSTGEVLLIGPATTNNLYAQDVRTADPDDVGNQEVRFVFPPRSNITYENRHSQRAFGRGDPSLGFPMRNFPAVVDSLTRNNSAFNNAGAMISSRNEEGRIVSVGYATTSTPVVDWIILFEQSRDEVLSPINHLRDIVLACVFGTTGLLILILFPLAHFAVRPIRQLREATSRSVRPIPPGSSSDQSVNSQVRDELCNGEEELLAVSPDVSRKEGFFNAISHWKNGHPSSARARMNRSGRQRSFKIPGKVPERKHWIQDELSDLTSTFNEMSDELVLQYASLEERVKDRTAELEESKKAAEAANASKTLFIANISHELKTPLNGILGMCTVCMQEEDIQKIRRSLGIIYKSGDLLLHLLTDLLTFSKNSIGQQLTIDESEFKLLDISTQVTSIFEKQAADGEIDLQVEFLGTCDAYGDSSDDAGPKLYGPSGTGRVRDICLWGDKNRILQVLINLVSNSLKFTPRGGLVLVKIQCTGLAEDALVNNASTNKKASVESKQARQSGSMKRKSRSSNAPVEVSSAHSDVHLEKKAQRGRAINIHVAGAMQQLPQVAVRRRSASPAPLNTKHLLVEFAVTDTGPGIPEEQMSRIFQPFVQGDLGLSKKFAGTGLGLSICAQLANLMGGGITLESTVGVGSTFSVQIPLRYVKERASSTSSSRVPLSSKTDNVGPIFHEDSFSRNVAVPDDPLDDLGPETRLVEDVPRIVGFSQPYFPKEVARTDSPQHKLGELRKAENEAAKTGKKVRVLVAEDNQVNQEVVTRMLKLESVYDVTIAKDGQEALDMVRESMESGQRFNLVFMDVQMPNLDGIQSTKLIREIGFSAPIIALTAFVEESNIQDCYACGMNFFLPKPIKRPELKKVLKKYCQTIHEDEAENGGSSAPNMNGKRSSKSGDGNDPSTTEGRESLKTSSLAKETPRETME